MNKFGLKCCFLFFCYIMSSYNTVKSNLLLRVCDITATIGTDVSNEVGTYSEKGAKVSWNMNWKTLLGNSYEKYDTFGIRLNSVSVVFYTFSTNNNDQIASVNVSGLNWFNNSYNPATQNNDGRCRLAVVPFTSATNVLTTIPNDTSIAYFRRPGMYDPITVELFRVGTPSGYISNTTNAGVPLFNCLFDVFPIELD